VCVCVCVCVLIVEDSQYVDNAARMRTIEATVEQLQALMKRATNVHEVLSVQSQMSSFVQQLESYKARLQYLERASAMSTLTVTIREEPPVPVSEVKPWFRWVCVNE
jgi:hypothetical protein